MHCLSATPGQLSAALVTNELIAPVAPDETGRYTDAGHVSTGSWVSFTRILKVHTKDATFVEQVMIVLPTGNVLPDAGLQITVPQLLTSGCGYKTVATHWFGVLETVILFGHIIAH